MMSNKELIKRIDERIAYWSEGLPSTGPTVELLKDCRAALTKKYVPMTDDEWEKLYAEYEAICFDKSPSPRYIEAEVIRRAGLEIQND